MFLPEKLVSQDLEVVGLLPGLAGLLLLMEVE